MIPAGRKRHEIVIQTPTKTQSTGSGAVTAGWGTYSAQRAEVLSLDGVEGWEGDAAVSRATHQVTCGYVPGVTANMRILWEGRLLWITSVVPDGRRRELVIRCDENQSREG